jgi:hypothetical protein
MVAFDGHGARKGSMESQTFTYDDATVTLYAQWKVMPCNPNATHFDDTVCLQDINPMAIKTMPYDEQYQLRDSRDERYYDVMRMADGNIWMQEDLHLINKNNFIGRLTLAGRRHIYHSGKRYVGIYGRCVSFGCIL